MRSLIPAVLFFGLVGGIFGDYLDINQCFKELPDYELTVDTTGVEAVEFKDDCLRACLRSQLRGKTCAGVEHRAKDNDCILSNRTGVRRAPGAKKKGSYYENVCAQAPGWLLQCIVIRWLRGKIILCASIPK